MNDVTEDPIFKAHLAGDSHRTLGERFGMSHEAARQVVLREGSRFVNEIEVSLMVAEKLEALGCENCRWTLS